MGLVQNLKKKLNEWGDKILVELSCLYIKQLAKQTTKKQDNSSPIMSSPSPLTTELQDTIIATSSQDTSERTTMIMETEDIVAHVRGWAIDKIDTIHEKLDGRLYDDRYINDAYAIYEEFAEWIEPESNDLEIVSIDEISKQEYDDYLERS